MRWQRGFRVQFFFHRSIVIPSSDEYDTHTAFVLELLSRNRARFVAYEVDHILTWRQIMKVRSVFVLTLFTAVAIASALASDNKAQSHNQSSVPSPQGRTAVVLRFAVETQPVTDATVLSAKACLETERGMASPDTATNIAVDPKILNNITEEMEKRLSKKMSVMVNPDPNVIPVGALVISGCITKANAGNSAARLVGMNLGASHLGVHIVALSRTDHGWAPTDTFDVKVKGGDLLPPLGPIGLAAHAAKDTRQGLSTEAKKLADQVVKKLAKDMKTREQIAKS